MRNRSIASVLGVCGLVAALGGCGDRDHHDDHAHAAEASEMWKDAVELVCVLHPTAGNQCEGVVRFTKVADGVKVVADIHGLTPNALHAIHVHQFGDCSATDATSAGDHYNPDGHPHGDPAKDEKRHAGDFGNLKADGQGKSHFELTVKNASLVGPQNPFLGRSVIVHAKADEFVQPTGNAGPRIACGAIGIAKR